MKNMLLWLLLVVMSITNISAMKQAASITQTETKQELPQLQPSSSMQIAQAPVAPEAFKKRAVHYKKTDSNSSCCDCCAVCQKLHETLARSDDDLSYEEIQSLCCLSCCCEQLGRCGTCCLSLCYQMCCEIPCNAKANAERNAEKTVGAICKWLCDCFIMCCRETQDEQKTEQGLREVRDALVQDVHDKKA